MPWSATGNQAPETGVWEWSTGSYWAPPESPLPAETVRSGQFLTLSDPEIPNSGRGMYEWLDMPLDPATWPDSGDGYCRDQIKWAALQPSQATFDLSTLEEQIALYAGRGGRMSFRIMPWMASAQDQNLITPSWIPRQAGSTAPDWNHSTFINGWVALWEKISEIYGAGRTGGPDPRIHYVDFGGLGDYGEMGDFGPTTPTRGNAVTVMTAVHNAFPTVPKAANWYNSPYPGEGWPEVAASIVTNGTLSLRNDSIGGFEQGLSAVNPLVQESWRTAPTVCEFGYYTGANIDDYLAYAQGSVTSFHMSLLSSGNKPFAYSELTAPQKTAYDSLHKSAGFRYEIVEVSAPDVAQRSGRIRVQASIMNVGNAPIYDALTVSAVLVDGSGAAWSFPLSGGDLRQSLGAGSTTQFAGTVTLPQSIGTGVYTVMIQVTHDRAVYLAPVRMANSGRDSAGRYPFGSVTVV